MNRRSYHSVPFVFRILKLAGFAMVLLFLADTAFAQNTKGDRPVNNQRKIRETKVKSVKKKEKGRTKDVANRRLRTKDQSSANRANAKYPQPSPYSGRNKKQERSARPLGRVFSKSPRESRTQAWKGDISGYPVKRIKPGRNDAARTNVYPQKGPYVRYARKQPKQRPPVYSRTIRGTRFAKHTPRTKERAWEGGVDKGPIKNQSATGSFKNTYSQKGPYVAYYRKNLKKKEKPVSNSMELATVRQLSRKPRTGGQASVYPFSSSRSFVQRGRKNVYWGKYQKKEKGYTGDITGGPLRTKNYKSMPAGLVGRDTVRTFGKKPYRDDRASHLGGGQIPTSRRGKGFWKGDLAGWKLRKSGKGKGETAGKFVWPRKLSATSKGERGEGRVPGGGVKTRTKKGEKAELRSVSALMLSRPLGQQPKGKKPRKGGGSISAAGWNNNGQPIIGKGPGGGSAGAARFSGTLRGGQRPAFSQKGPGYSGNIKKSSFVGFSKDGTDYSGKIKRSSIRGFSKDGAGYSGNIKRSSARGFSRDGTNYSGNIKRSQVRGFSKDGTNYSGNIKRSQLRGFEDDFNYSGTIKRSQLRGFSKDGAGYAGNIKRSRARGFSTVGADYSGNMKRSQLRGFSKDGAGYAGNIKRSRIRGFSTVGADYSGNMKRNRTPGFAEGIDYSGRIRRSKVPGFVEGTDYSGRIKRSKVPGFVEGTDYSGRIKRSSIKGFSTQGIDYAGTKRRVRGFNQEGAGYAGGIKYKRPEKGGGSVSGKLWNNDNQALQGSPPGSKQGGDFAGNIKYKRPEKGGGSVSGKLWNNNNQALQGEPPASKQGVDFGGNIKYKRPEKGGGSVSGKLFNNNNQPLSRIPASSATLKASEYSRSMKQYWHYKHNPNSAKLALKVVEPGKANARIGDFQGNTKMHKYRGSRLHPDAQFAHGFRDNVKEERTILINVKLMWGKLFRKSETQPENLKQKPSRPGYDKREKGLWND